MQLLWYKFCTGLSAVTIKDSVVCNWNFWVYKEILHKREPVFLVRPPPDLLPESCVESFHFEFERPDAKHMSWFKNMGFLFVESLENPKGVFPTGIERFKYWEPWLIVNLKVVIMQLVMLLFAVFTNNISTHILISSHDYFVIAIQQYRFPLVNSRSEFQFQERTSWAPFIWDLEFVHHGR